MELDDTNGPYREVAPLPLHALAGIAVGGSLISSVLITAVSVLAGLVWGVPQTGLLGGLALSAIFSVTAVIVLGIAALLDARARARRRTLLTPGEGY